MLNRTALHSSLERRNFIHAPSNPLAEAIETLLRMLIESWRHSTMITLVQVGNKTMVLLCRKVLSITSQATIL